MQQQFKEYKLAAGYYEQTIKLDAGNPNFWFNYGLLLRVDMKNYPDAKIKFEKAIACDSNFTEAYIELGKLYQFHMDNLPKAEENYQKALSIAPKNTHAKQLLEGAKNVKSGRTKT